MEVYLGRLEGTYRVIDNLYASAQRAYGFGCEGCADSCCLTNFYHYTLVEELFLLRGFSSLPPEKKRLIAQKAGSVVEIYSSSGEDVRVPCPLNEKGLCVVYEYRPMICRMHGVPYLTFRQDGTVEYGTGCSRFIGKYSGRDFVFYPFNRTMFYHEVARIEKEVRAAAGVSIVPRKTIAEMLLQRGAE